MRRSDLIRTAAILKPLRNIRIGELKLQSCEEANIFYAAELLLQDNNLAFGDFSEPRNWKHYPITHKGKMLEETVIVDADSTVILGVFQDSLGEAAGKDLEYVVNVYIWVEIED